VPFYFAVAAVLFVFSRRKHAAAGSERFLILFFAATLALMLLKRYGSPLINWIGGLPLSDMVVYPKYLEPLIALCVADAGRSGLLRCLSSGVQARGCFVLAGVIVLAFCSVRPGGTCLKCCG